MNTRSIRFHFTLWYSMAFFITVAIVFTFFFLATRQILYTQTDNTLAAHGEKILEILNRQETGIYTMLEKEAFIRDFSEIPGMLVVVVDKSGRVINSTSSNPPDIPVLNRLVTLSQEKHEPIYADENITGSNMRFWVTTVLDSNGDPTGTVFVAHPLDIIKSSLESLLVLLTMILFISIIPAIAGGYLLAKRALVPIEAITGELKRITSESLDKRVPNPGTGDELEELSVTFNSLLDRLNLAFKRERQFIGDVAHELKTPLSILQSSFEIALSKNRTKEEYKRGYEEALIDTDKISSTLKNILDLAWSDADDAALTGEKFDLSNDLTELYELATKMALIKKIHVSARIVPDIFVRGKKDKLNLALLNIIENAIKYTPERGGVAMGLSKKDGHIIIEIKDSGPGISEEDLPHIFDRFYRGGKKSSTIGSGLGLAIAKAAIASHHGEIKAHSSSRGSLFTVTLPLASS